MLRSPAKDQAEQMKKEEGEPLRQRVSDPNFFDTCQVILFSRPSFLESLSPIALFIICDISSAFFINVKKSIYKTNNFYILVVYSQNKSLCKS